MEVTASSPVKYLTTQEPASGKTLPGTAFVYLPSVPLLLPVVLLLVKPAALSLAYLGPRLSKF